MAKKNLKKEDDSKLFAFLATFLSIVGFVIAILVRKDNKYVMFYAKQSLVVFVFSIIGWIVGLIVLPIQILGYAINFVIPLIVILFWLISWIYALSGEMKEVPFVGGYSKNIKL